MEVLLSELAGRSEPLDFSGPLYRLAKGEQCIRARMETVVIWHLKRIG